MSQQHPDSTPGYPALEPQLDLPSVDEEVLAFWRERDIFAASVAKTADGQPWTFYEGPPTANGMPGTHHVEARVFKDVFPRFQTMRGRHVERKAGWDCHGLPVEVAVEKELGLKGKGDIEEYGVAEFNAACRESVLRHVDAFTELTDRMGFWVDMSEAYRTMDASYVESVWWSLKQIFDKGLLTRDHRITPYCPRCGTGLSDHELGQPGVYQQVLDPSVYVRLPLTSGPWAGRADLLVWTTTPWTLVTNTLVAAHPDVEYVVATDGTRTVVLAEALIEAVLGEGWELLERYTGAQLERWSYQRPFELVGLADANFVGLADYVSTEDGTGLVHTSPAYGADDYQLGQRYGVPIVNPIGGDGRFESGVPLVGGMYFKDADVPLAADLRERGLMFRETSYEHSYPHCWRCDTALLYYALPSWYVKTTRFAERMLEENERTGWYPDTIKHGRYGEWLRNNVDWALSRNRYWGTPLPVWVSDEDPSQMVCVGSLAELSDLTGEDLAELDPHRPYVDDVTFTRPGVPGIFRRVPEVIDAWYDSGSMPFAQWGYPYVEGSKERLEQAYPAQFICEAIDQTRGWFYSLMAVGTAVFDRSSYENVLCLGLILAEDGRKMSKHLGNIVAPIPLLQRHGADAVRWFMACSGSPWAARRVGDGPISEVVRKVLLTYWNTVAFQALYARTAGWTPAQGGPAVDDRPLLDRWLTSRTHALVRDTTAAYEDFDTQTVGRAISAFVDDLSNWYVRRSRRRFWSGESAALATLHETLRTLTQLLAPLTPFVAERVWRDLVCSVEPDAAESVHLSEWPAYDEALVDDRLGEQVDVARRVVELGRSARAEAKVRTRQPLARALVGAAGWNELPADLQREIAEELNVVSVQGLGDLGIDLVEYVVKPNFRALGKVFGKRTPVVAAAVNAADPNELATAIGGGGRATVTVDGEPVELGADEVTVHERPREGWSVANAHGETVALDLSLDDELRRAGLAREVIRLVQDARKSAGFEVTDRIRLGWRSDDPETSQAITDHAERLADEVLAREITVGDLGHDDAAYAVRSDELGLDLWLSRAATAG